MTQVSRTGRDVPDPVVSWSIASRLSVACRLEFGPLLLIRPRADPDVGGWFRPPRPCARETFSYWPRYHVRWLDGAAVPCEYTQRLSLFGAQGSEEMRCHLRILGMASSCSEYDRTVDSLSPLG